MGHLVNRGSPSSKSEDEQAHSHLNFVSDLAGKSNLESTATRYSLTEQIRDGSYTLLIAIENGAITAVIEAMLRGHREDILRLLNKFGETTLHLALLNPDNESLAIMLLESSLGDYLVQTKERRGRTTYQSMLQQWQDAPRLSQRSSCACIQTQFSRRIEMERLRWMSQLKAGAAPKKSCGCLKSRSITIACEGKYHASNNRACCSYFTNQETKNDLIVVLLYNIGIASHTIVSPQSQHEAPGARPLATH